MYRNVEEIKTVEDWQWVLWDMKNDVQFFGSATGTIMTHVEQRYIQNIYGKIVHVPDDGELEISSSDECGAYQVRLRCLVCNKEFFAEV